MSKKDDKTPTEGAHPSLLIIDECESNDSDATSLPWEKIRLNHDTGGLNFGHYEMVFHPHKEDEVNGYFINKKQARKLWALKTGRNVIQNENAIQNLKNRMVNLGENLRNSEQENERLRMQLAACGVIAGCNTEKSKKRQEINPDSKYYSDSYRAVLACVNREIRLSKALATIASFIKEFLSHDWVDELETIEIIVQEALEGGSK